MATNPNMVAIETVEVGSGGAAEIDFQNIPQTYTDLYVLLSGRTTRSEVTDSIYIKFNNNTTGYTFRDIDSNGSTVSSGSYSDYPAARVTANTATANTFGTWSAYVPNYTGSNNKSVSLEGVSENNASTAFIRISAGLWSNSAAITRITLISQNAQNFMQYSTATLYGVTSAGYGAKATGGIITSDADYFYHTFLSSGTFTPSENLTADYLVVAGGGGGPADSGSTGGNGGGGAGGLRSTVSATGGGGSLESALSLTASTNYTVTVGAGGSSGGNGSNSVFDTITSTGGGKGGRRFNNENPGSGGSGGGGYGDSVSSIAGGAGTTNQGFAGGANLTSSGYGSGGGGGAGAVGASATSLQSGAGGVGVSNSINGSAIFYAGGGGGGATINGALAGAGGNGGGGAGGFVPVSGTANTGGGGGGGDGGGSTASNGGSGIVIVRYAK